MAHDRDRNRESTLFYLLDRYRRKGCDDELMMKILNDPSLNVNYVCTTLSLLQIAVYHNNIQATKILLDRKADPNYKNGYDRMAIHCATEGSQGDDRYDIVKLLIDHGSMIDPIDSWGRTPLFNACTNGSYKIASLLVSKGAGVNHTNDCGETPLFRAYWSSDTRMVKLLVENGASTDIELSEEYRLKIGNKMKRIIEYIKWWQRKRMTDLLTLL